MSLQIGPNALASQPEYQLIHQIPQIYLAITGDYKFYNTMIGKPNMESRWCMWCKLYSGQWKKGEGTAEDKELWTFQSMIEQHQKFLNDPKLTAMQIKGVKQPMILQVDPRLYVIPTLHSKLGLVN